MIVGNIVWDLDSRKKHMWKTETGWHLGPCAATWVLDLLLATVSTADTHETHQFITTRK